MLSAWQLPVLALWLTQVAPSETSPSSDPRRDRCVVRARFDDPLEERWARHQSNEQWNRAPNGELTLELPCSRAYAVRERAASFSWVHRSLDEDIQNERIRVHRHMADKSPRQSDDIDYLDFEGIEAHLAKLVSDNPTLVALESIGQSVQGRPLHVLTLGHDEQREPAKPRVFILGGHHAREWLAHAATLCVLERLIQDAANGRSHVSQILDKISISVLPMGNPDGYVHTWTKDRLWRKNLGADGRGVDLNRNWDVAWGEASSSNPEHATFHGSAPFSEPETLAISSYIASHPELVGFVDIHAFASVMLYPYGYQEQDHEELDRYSELTAEMSTQMAAVGDAYMPMSIFDFIGGPASGSSVDWVSVTDSDALALAFEVRGESFIEDPAMIVPTCDELSAALDRFFLACTESTEDPDESDTSSTSDSDASSSASDNDSTDSTQTTDTNLTDSEATHSDADANDSTAATCNCAAKRNSPWALFGLSLGVGLLAWRHRRRRVNRSET